MIRTLPYPLFIHIFLWSFLLNVIPVANAQIKPTDYSYPVVTQSENYIFRVVTVVDRLEHPWALAFLPDGNMLVTERPGRLRIVRNGVLDPEPISGIPPLWYLAEGNSGLLDVALHPNFVSNRLVYFTYGKPSADGSQGTLAAARGRFDGQRLSDVEDIFVANSWGEVPDHIGSRIAFDGNGHVFISHGDRLLWAPSREPREKNPAQDLSNHAGTIVRLHDDGRVPADNPFVNIPGALPEIWSYGHRNIQGMAIDHETGVLWATDHGPDGGDELNHIRPGRNYGWPVISYGRGPAYQTRTKEDMEQPVTFWSPSIAPSGLMIYYGDKFPEWRGDVFVGGLIGHALHRLRPFLMSPDGSYTIVSVERPPLLQGFGRVRDVREGPDGYIYLSIDDHRNHERLSAVVRLEPVESVEFNPHYHPFIFGDEGAAARGNR